MVLDGCEDTRRKLIELHVDSAKKRLSPQTGLLHLYYDDPTDAHQNTIPVLENMYFALGLFRTRLSDPILEARQLIEEILPFEVDGNFPIYLHQYPACRDRCLSLHLLPVLHYLLTDYRQVLGEELTEKLENLSLRISTRGKEIQEEKKLPFGAEVKLASFKKSLTPKEPTTSQEWADYLLALHMVKDEPFVEGEIERAASLWNSSLGIYVGEEKSHPQEGFFPKATLFDLFMTLQTDSFSQQIFSHHTLLLSASLVHAFEKKSLPFTSDPIAILTPKEGRAPASIFWKENQSLRSLSIELASGSSEIVKTEDGIELIFTYPEEIPTDEENSEIALYIDSDQKVSLIVDGFTASTFRLGQQSALVTETSSISLNFSLQEGEGKFFGHVSKGNRPSQSRKDPFLAFDWKIGLRTIQRTSICKMKVALVLSSKEALVLT